MSTRSVALNCRPADKLVTEHVSQMRADLYIQNHFWTANIKPDSACLMHEMVEKQLSVYRSFCHIANKTADVCRLIQAGEL